ncbi:MAG: Na+/H+ antiporter [Omnitrophica WOR_2 bacterium]
MQEFLSTETLIIELLLVASLVAIAVRRLRIPYTVALVVVGLLLTAQSHTGFELTPELILALFVPPLIFEAAFHLNISDLRQNLVAILVLAVPGVILTMLIIGGVLVFGTSLSLPVALVFGALIAATDPVAVVALFRILGVPRQLEVLVEGESLFNDGTALVLFNLMLAVAITGHFSLVQSILDFVRVAAGGAVVGLVLGWAVSRLIARIDDYLIETTLTTVLAFGSYLIAEQLHFSGVLAVVAAGLINGNLGPQGMSPTTRIILFNFWEYLAFLANSLVFLLIGLQIEIPTLLRSWQPILWAIGAVLAARILVIYGLSWAASRLGEPVSKRWRYVLVWGGLRGALSLALALSLPIAFGPDRSLLLTMTFGVVLFTLLVQATTMRPFIRKLGIITRNPAQIEYEVRHAELTASRAAEAHLERRYREGIISTHAWELLKPQLQEQNAELAKAVRAALRSEPSLEAEELDIARREILRAKRSAYLGLLRDGIISEDAFDRLATQVDTALDEKYESASTELPVKQTTTSEENKLELREILIQPGSAVDGRLVRHVAWPKNFIIANLRRGDETVVPHGDTILRAGDILVAVATHQSFQEAQALSLTESQSPN